MKKISLVVPCYNEEETIELYYDEVNRVFAKEKYELEVIFVNDGSHDNSLNIMKKICKKDSRFNYVDLSRNSGKEAAMLAGLKYVTGDYIAVMDVDLQDPPKLVPEMARMLDDPKENWDIIGTRRVTRKGEPPIRSFFARCFYKLINKMSDVEMVDGARDFRLMKRMVLDSILELNEVNRYSKGLFSYVGYHTKWLEYENIERSAGTTKWSFKKLFVYAIEGIISFTTTLLKLAIYLGILFIIAAIVMLIITLVKHLSVTYHLIWIILLSTGNIMIVIGIMSLYLSKSYLEIKNRPIYFVRETNMRKNEKN